MIFVHRPQTDPFFNLAAEEFLLKNRKEDMLMLWQSKPSVIVGKHQNLVAEVNLEYTGRNNIPVIRRISGGGTVFHDLGNINLSVITTAKNRENLVDFRNFTQPVIEFLQEYGLHPVFEGKNNLSINGKKFSGNAAHVFKNKILYHGTLLYQTDLDTLKNTIPPDNNHILDKSIKSVQATVGNISGHLTPAPALPDFLQHFKLFLKRYYRITEESNLSDAELQAIEKLAAEKYKTWEWNRGYSPPYTLRQKCPTAYGDFEVVLAVSKGIISKIQLSFEGKRLEKIEQKLLRQKHDKKVLYSVLADNRFSETIIQTLF